MLYIMTGLIQNFQYNVPIKKLFKYISSVRQILGIIPVKKIAQYLMYLSMSSHRN